MLLGKRQTSEHGQMVEKSVTLQQAHHCDTNTVTEGEGMWSLAFAKNAGNTAKNATEMQFSCNGVCPRKPLCLSRRMLICWHHHAFQETTAPAQHAKHGRESHPSSVVQEEGCYSLGKKQYSPNTASAPHPIEGTRPSMDSLTAPTTPFPLPRTLRRGRVLFPPSELDSQGEVEGIESDMSIAKGRI